MSAFKEANERAAQELSILASIVERHKGAATMSDFLKPCDCEPGYCNKLPNPFVGYVCGHETTEVREEFNKALTHIAKLEQERDQYRAWVVACHTYNPKYAAKLDTGWVLPQEESNE